MITGRKLLLADDSIAIQKVIDLTFTDEGMEVTTVGDGQDALDKLNQFTPDVVLADIFMPGVDGYELCKFIKKDERFRGVPVMLLVGSFEPFDEAEAKRAGADDVVTKPFQSIRDLVSRVGSLVSHEDAVRQNSVFGLDKPEEPVDETTAAEGAESAEQTNVRVFVEAPSMEPDATVFVEASAMEVEPAAIPEHTCPEVIDLQTADTQQLEPISTVATTERETIELQVAYEESSAEPAQAQFITVLPPRESAQVKFDDEGVLDLGDIDSFATATSEDDFVLDVEVEPVTISSAACAPGAPVNEPTPVEEVHPVVTEFVDARETAFEPVQEPVLTRVADEPADEVSAAPLSTHAQASGLSSDEIEAISRRVVEQMSDKVVREIAWEVVPELSELLIKRRLEEPR
ncbi:MAG: response regulator [Pyrinomonadaceae bacterium]